MTNRQMHKDKLMGLSYINALLSDYLNAVEKKHNNYDNNWRKTFYVTTKL